jgi:D-alanine-D-alanine ligase
VKRLRVLVLVHHDLIPPDTLEGQPADAIQPWRTEYDVVQGLRKLGHQVQVLGISHDLLPIRRTAEAWRPDVVFNLLVEFQDVGAFQVHVVSYLELLGLRFTGCNSRGVLLSRDKALAKKILRYHRIPTPSFVTFTMGRAVKHIPRIAFPLIVKSVDEDASLGVAQASLVRTPEQLAERVAFVHRHVQSDAIVEEFVQGRELTLSILGHERLQAFPCWELHFGDLTEGGAAIATARVKWDAAYQKARGIRTAAAELSPALALRIARLGKRAFRALELSGFARLDLRLTEDERVFVIEANANPDLRTDEDFACSAAHAGVGYAALLQRIVGLAERQRPLAARI